MKKALILLIIAIVFSFVARWFREKAEDGIGGCLLALVLIFVIVALLLYLGIMVFMR